MTNTKKELLPNEADRLYYRYGVAVNEDRAIPCEIDGLKPVARRALWAVHKQNGHSKAKLLKSAVYVGETMGSYHPHGDKAIYDTYVTLVNSPYKLIFGEGNWGSISDKSVAAMRYTLLRMSAFSEKVFFDRFYLPVITSVPNYDDSKKEPLHLVSLLPNLILNGSFGIGVGVRTEIPSFTLKSVAKVIVQVMNSGKDCSVKDCLNLEFTSLYEGKAVSDKLDLINLYKNGKGKVSFISQYEIVKGHKNTIHVTKFAPFSSIEKAIEKASLLGEVVKINDISDIADKYGRIEIQFKPNLSSKEFGIAIDRVMTGPFGASESYDTKITQRFVDKTGQGFARLKSSTIPSIIDTWITYRIDLEKRACLYWTNERQVEIDYLKLMLLAVKNRKFIIQALDKKFTDEELAAYIAKHLKITVEQANQILDLRIRQLKALEEKKLLGKVKVLKDEIAGYADRIKRPKTYITKQVTEFAKEFTQ